MKTKAHWVMDYETICNCFISVFIHYKNDKVRKYFVVSEFRDDFDAYVDFLKENVKNQEYHISYNGLGFDSQITQYVLENHQEWKGLSPLVIARIIYGYAQTVINKQELKEMLDYAPYKLSIKQIDVFKLNHWDNPAKMSSLKWIQYSMDWFSVLEMPHHHNDPITSEETQRMVLDYCVNDVESTRNIMEISKEQINLRLSLSKEYKIDLLSASEPRISKELFAYFLTNKLGIDKKELKQLRTPRKQIILEDCILPYISFKTPEFNNLLNFFKSKVVVETKGALDYKVTYKGVDSYYGLGGIHGAAKAGIYEAKPGWTIMSSDVTSFYPNLAIRNGFAPAHLPKKDFLELYEWFFEERKKIPKSDPKNYVYKIILNSTYGLSNDENSFLYDPQMTMQITVNGQLQLSMLYEMLAEAIPDCQPLMQNTDGLEMMIPEKDVQTYMDVCAEWEKITNLGLEHDEYKKMIIGDVNNYIAIYKKEGKIPKCKGRFEWEALSSKSASTLHKNKSFLVIPKGIYEYFVNGVKPEDYVRNHTNFLDFCGGAKAKGKWFFEKYSIVDGVEKFERLQKIIRYYVSTKGSKIVKKEPASGRAIQVLADRWLLTEMNLINDDTETPDDINYQFYIDSINKEIENISNIKQSNTGQLELFGF
jgi:hypothetical protein